MSNTIYDIYKKITNNELEDGYFRSLMHIMFPNFYQNFANSIIPYTLLQIFDINCDNIEIQSDNSNIITLYERLKTNHSKPYHFKIFDVIKPSNDLILIDDILNDIITKFNFESPITIFPLNFNHYITFIIYNIRGSLHLAYINAGNECNIQSEKLDTFSTSVNGIIFLHKIFNESGTKQDIDETTLKKYIARAMYLSYHYDNVSNSSEPNNIINELSPMESFNIEILGRICGINKNIKQDDATKFLLQNFNDDDLTIVQYPLQVSGSCSITVPININFFKSIYYDLMYELIKDRKKRETKYNQLLIQNRIKFFHKINQIYQQTLKNNIAFKTIFIDKINSKNNSNLHFNNYLYIMYEITNKNKEFLEANNSDISKFTETLVQINNFSSDILKNKLSYESVSFKRVTELDTIVNKKSKFMDILSNIEFTDIQLKYNNFIDFNKINNWDDLTKYLETLDKLILSIKTNGVYYPFISLNLLINIAKNVFNKINIVDNTKIMVDNLLTSTFNDSTKSPQMNCTKEEFNDVFKIILEPDKIIANLFELISKLKFDRNNYFDPKKMNSNPNDSLSLTLKIIFSLFFIVILGRVINVDEPNKKNIKRFLSTIDYNIVNIDNTKFINLAELFSGYFKEFNSINISSILSDGNYLNILNNPLQTLKPETNKYSKYSRIMLNQDLNLLEYSDMFKNFKINKLTDPIILTTKQSVILENFSMDYIARFINFIYIDHDISASSNIILDTPYINPQYSIFFPATTNYITKNIYSTEINNNKLIKMNNFINRFLENNFNDLDLLIDLDLPYWLNTNLTRKFQLYDIVSTSDYNSNVSKNVFYTNFKNLIDKLCDNKEKIPIQNLINLGILYLIFDEINKKCEFIQTTIYDLSKSLKDSTEKDILLLLSYNFHKDKKFDCNVLINIFNKYNHFPQLESNEKNFITNKINNIFNQDIKNIINSLLLRIITNHDIFLILPIKCLYETEKETQIFHFNLGKNKHIYHQIENSDVNKDIKFKKVNNNMYESDKYILIKNQIIDLTFNFKEDSLNKYYIHDSVKTQIGLNFLDDTSNDLLAYTESSANTKLRIINKTTGFNLLFVKYDSEYIIYSVDNTNNYSVVGICKITFIINIRSRIVSNIYDIKKFASNKSYNYFNNWYLLAKNNEPSHNLTTKFVIKNMIDVPHFTKSTNNIDINIDTYGCHIILVNMIKAKTNKSKLVDYKLEYILKQINNNIQISSKRIKMDDKYIIPTSIINDASMLSNKSFEQLINNLVQISSPSNIIYWKVDNNHYFMMAEYDSLIIWNNQTSIINIYTSDNSYENLKLIDKDNLDYDYLVDPFGFINLNSGKIVSLSKYHMLNPIKDENIIFSPKNKNESWYLNITPKEKGDRDSYEFQTVRLNSHKLNPTNKIYAYNIHNSKINISFDDLESMLYYLSCYYSYNSSLLVLDFMENLIKKLVIEMNYSIYEKDIIDIKHSNYNIPKIIIRLCSFCYTNTESMIMNNIILSVINGSKLHNCIKKLFYEIFDFNFKFEFKFNHLLLISEQTRNRFSNYLNYIEYSYTPLYFNLYLKYLPDFELIPSLNNEQYDSIFNIAQGLAQCSFYSDNLKNLLDNPNNIFYFYNNLQFEPDSDGFDLKSRLNFKHFDPTNIFTDFFYTFEYDNKKYFVLDYYRSGSHYLHIYGNHITNFELIKPIYDIDTMTITSPLSIKSLSDDILIDLYNFKSFNSEEGIIQYKTNIIDYYNFMPGDHSKKTNWLITDMDTAYLGSNVSSQSEPKKNLLSKIKKTVQPDIAYKDALNYICKKMYRLVIQKYITLNLGPYVFDLLTYNENSKNREYKYASKIKQYSSSSINMENMVNDKKVTLNVTTEKLINTMIYEINQLTIIKIENKKITDDDIDKDAKQAINLFLDKSNYLISNQNKQKLKDIINKTKEELNKKIIIRYDKLIKEITFKNKLSIKNYITENFENIERCTGFISMVTLLNNLKYLSSLIQIDTHCSNINLDLLPVLVNMPFNYYLKINDTDPNKIIFELCNRPNSELEFPLRYLFEFTFGLLRSDQIEKLYQIINKVNNLTSDTEQYDLHQLIMAAGKTDVLTPFLGLYYNFKGENFIDVTLSTLIKTTINAIINKSSLLFNINLFELSFNPSVKNIVTNLNNEGVSPYIAFNNDNTLKRGIYVMSDLNFKTSILNHQQFKYQERKELNQTDIIKEYKECVIVMDEVDDILDVIKSELNFPYNIKKEKNYISYVLIEIIINIANDLIKGKYEGIGELNNDIFRLSNKIYSPTNLCYINKLLKKISSKSYKNINTKLEDIINYYIEDKMIGVEVYNLLTKTLELIKNMIYNKDYGFGNEDYPDINLFEKSRYIVLPYDGLKKPAYGSEFSNNNITILLTAIALIKNGINGNYINKILQIIYDIYSNSINLEQSEEILDKYKQIKYYLYKKYQIILPDDLTYLNVAIKYQNFNNINLPYEPATKKIFTLVFTQVINKYLVMTDSKYNISSNDLIQRNIIGKFTGYTGTLYIHNILDITKTISNYNLDNSDKLSDSKILKIQPDNTVNGEIYACLLGKNINTRGNIYWINVSEEKQIYDEELVDSMLEKFVINGYKAIVDVGAYFKDFDNKSIAIKWKDKLNKKSISTGFIIFFDNKNDKYVIDISKQNQYDKYDKYDENVHNNLYIYFDQSHITGINVDKLEPNARGIATIDDYNNLRDLAQGMYRLRKIKSGQTIDLLITPKTKNKLMDINDRIEIKELNNEISQDPIAKKTFLMWIIKQQNNIHDNKKTTYYKQTIKTLIRQVLSDSHIYKCLKDKEEFKQLVYEGNTRLDTNEYLICNILPTKIDDITKDMDDYFIEEFDSIIKLLSKNYISDEYYNGFNNKITQVQMERSLDKQKDTEKEKENEKEKLKNRITTNNRILSNYIPKIKYQVTDSLEIDNYININTIFNPDTYNKIKCEINKLHSTDNVKKNYLLMIITYISKFENKTNIITNIDLDRLTTNLFTNYIPLIPGINISKFIINANQDPKYKSQYIYNLVGSSNIIGIVKDMTNSIFILTMSEYIFLKNKSVSNIEFYSIVGRQLFTDTIKILPTPRQKLLIDIVSLINGKYKLENNNEEVNKYISGMYEMSTNKLYNDFVRIFYSLFFDNVVDNYKNNYNNYNIIDDSYIKFNISFKSKYYKYKNKYIQLKNSIFIS